MRITDMITQDEYAWYFINFSPLFCWEWIGATSDNSNFDLRGLNGLMGWFFLFVMPWTWFELWWCRIYLCSLHSFPVFPDLLLKNCWCFFRRKQACPRSAFSYKQKSYYFTKKQGMSQLSHPSKAGHPANRAASPYPFNPNSDQHQCSLNNIYILSREKIVRINKMITKRKCFDLLSYSLNSFFKEVYRDQFLENLYVDLRA